MTSLEIALPLPPPGCAANFRGHWSARHRARRRYRGTAKILAIQALDRRPPPRWEAARVKVIWCTHGPTAPDPDNIVSAMKSAFDGLQDAGVIKNDRTLWPERPEIERYAPHEEVRLVVTKEDNP